MYRRPGLKPPDQKMLLPPHCAIRFRNVEGSETQLIVGRNFNLQVITGFELNPVLAGDWFQHQLLNERGHTAVADDTQGKGLRFAVDRPHRRMEIQPDPALLPAHRISDKTLADGCARRRSGDQVKAAVVLRALNRLADNQAIGQVCIPCVHMPSLVYRVSSASR